ncbi:ADP-ribosylglycohydrolase family protein [Pseudolysinimonas sp.]|uniref:ADP-ribosylglycohydrolase family protein n=1 Tax=Pseudolysinimonas sp. TaxID=2680009 RepID=UPI003F817584
MSSWIEDRALAVVTGSAVGDALGGATEGFTPEAIEERYGGRVEGIVPPFFADWQTHRPISPYHKGDGHITDDTLMTQALIEVYAERREHLDAFAMADGLVPRLIGDVRWIPELERETVLLNRIFLAEKWMVTRLQYGHIDPREAGVGNVVNCGAAMYLAPVGVVNAGDATGAYREAIDLAGAHQSSYGREAAGAFAAAVAAALAPGADPLGVADAVLSVSHDGTRAAVAAVVEAATTVGDASDREIGARLRDAIRPFDTVGERYREPAADARIPSRTKSIEEFPVALGMVIAHGGDYRRAVLGAVNYGRDSDSIASMAGAIIGAMHGSHVVPAEWVEEIGAASRVDFGVHAGLLAQAASDILERDRVRALAAVDRIGALADPERLAS